MSQFLISTRSPICRSLWTDVVSLQTVLSGDVYTNLSFLVDMMDVSLELLDSPKPTEQKRSLARFLSSYCSIKNYLEFHFFLQMYK